MALLTVISSDKGYLTLPSDPGDTKSFLNKDQILEENCRNMTKAKITVEEAK